jgi:hypothetical protein
MHKHSVETFRGGHWFKGLGLLAFELLVGATLIGCGSAGTGDDQPNDARPPESTPADASGQEIDEAAITPQILNDFNIGDERYSFQLTEDDGSILLVHEFRAVSRLDVLNERYGLLTGLETFKALAPLGTDPHPLLVAAHESEALAYHRADLAVRELDGRDLAVPKDTQGLCQTNLVYSSISPLQWVEKGGFTRIDLDNVYFYTCAGLPQKSGQGNPLGCEVFHPKYLLRMAICNDIAPGTNDPVDYKFYKTGQQVLDPFYKPLGLGENKTMTMLPSPNPPQPVVARSLGATQKNRNSRPDQLGNVSYQRGGVGL